MKIEIPLLAGLLIIGTDFLARVAVQGVEQALAAMAVECVMSGIRTVKRFFPDAMRLL